MIELKIKGMTCQHCVKAVRDALAAVPGVTEVESVSLDDGSATVKGSVQADRLIAAVRGAGYEAEAPD